MTILRIPNISCGARAHTVRAVITELDPGAGVAVDL
jgi:copper chaperone CopZ